jgi:hypothetical protein
MRVHGDKETGDRKQETDVVVTEKALIDKHAAAVAPSV